MTVWGRGRLQLTKRQESQPAWKLGTGSKNLLKYQSLVFSYVLFFVFIFLLGRGLDVLCDGEKQSCCCFISAAVFSLLIWPYVDGELKVVPPFGTAVSDGYVWGSGGRQAENSI